MPHAATAIQPILGKEYILGDSFRDFHMLYKNGLRIWKEVPLTSEDGWRSLHTLYLSAVREESNREIIFAGYIEIENKNFSFIGMSVPSKNINIKFSF
jgi:hypothetical protein